LTAALQRAVQGADTIVHLAARVHVMSDAAADPLAEHRPTNVAGTEAVLNVASAAGVGRFLFTSTVKAVARRRRFLERECAAGTHRSGRPK
jgi:UDP-glucose 4-epimerase